MTEFRNPEFVRRVTGNGFVVGLIQNHAFLDDKWFDDSFSRSDSKKFIVVKFSEEYLAYIGNRKLSATGYSGEVQAELAAENSAKPLRERVPFNSLFMLAREKFMDGNNMERFTDDDFLVAQDKYIEWANKSCGKTCEPVKITSTGTVFPGDD